MSIVDCPQCAASGASVHAAVRDAWAAVDAGDFRSVLCGPTATVVGRVTDDEHAALLPALYDRESLILLFRERIVAALEAAVCERCAVATVAATAAACLQLFVQDSITGPEVSEDGAASVHPLPYAASMLEREGRGPGGSTGASSSGAKAAAASAARLNSERIRQWRSDTDAAAAASVDVDVEDGTSSALPALPAPLLSSYSLAALASSGEDSYEFTRYAHWLVTARALFDALVRPSTSASESVPNVVEDDPFPVLSLEARDPRLATLFALTDSMPILHWWAGRAAVMHQRSLVERHANAALWATTHARFLAAGSALCPELVAAFDSHDIFHAWMVRRVLSETGVAGTREAEEPTRPGEGEADGATWRSPPPACTRSEADREVVATLLLEWGMAQHWCGHADGAKTAFLLAKRESGLGSSLTGALGKRTKYQLHDTAQLVLRAASGGRQLERSRVQTEEARLLGSAEGRFSSTAVQGSESAEEAAPDTASDTTSDPGLTSASESVDGGASVSASRERVLGGVAHIALSESDPDGHVLERPNFRTDGASYRTPEEEAARDRDFRKTGWGQQFELSRTALPPCAPAPVQEDGALSALDQAIVLALCLDIHNHNPTDGLTAEEMRPYCERVLDTPLNWMVHSTGLLVRSRLEGDSHRTAERAVLQLQALVDQHASRLTALQATAAVVASAAPSSARLALVHGLSFPTRWDLRRQVAERYRRLGAVRAALALYEDLGLWDDIIDCCIVLDKAKRAERIVRARLAVAPTPRLWCCLGLITNLDEHYETAWEVSGRRFAKAQLSLGRRRLDAGRTDAARKALRMGLALSPHLDAEWFLLGVVDMRAGDLEDAVDSFSRCVQLDPTRGDAWANLGSIYLHTGSWDRGFAALEQATKADKRDFRIWSNYLVACVRTCNWARGMFVQRVLLDLYVQLGAGTEAGTGGGGVDVPALQACAVAVLASIAESKRDGQEAETLDASGNPARVHLEPLARLLDRIAEVTSRDARVWDVAAQVATARGRAADAHECRLRQVRSLQVAGWERSETAVAAVAAGAGHVVDGYLTIGDATSLVSAQLFVGGLLGRIDAGGQLGELPAAVALRDLGVKLGTGTPIL